MIDKKVIQEALAVAMSTGGDFAELFIEDRTSLGISMMKGIVENSLSGRDFGIGLRIFRGLNSIYTYMSGNDSAVLIELARRAAGAISGVPRDYSRDLTVKPMVNNHFIKISPSDVEIKKKVDLMRTGSNAAFEYSDLISQVVVNYNDHRQNIVIANTDGLYAQDERVRTRYYLTAVASDQGKMETGNDSMGRMMGFEMFDDIDCADFGRETARSATVMIHAANSPSGKFPIVMENKFGGVIFHEACGHGLEATSAAKGNTVYSNKIGQMIASPLVSAVDDGTLPNSWGSLNIDDEGSPTQRNLLIDKGILKTYMVDRLNGLRMKMDPTGSSRRQNYRFAPTSRMTNTYILDGESSHESLFEDVELGLYAAKLGGGQVNPSNGEFNFSVQEGYLIKDGKIADPVKGATLVGTGIEVLEKIDKVSNTFGSAEGMCGSISGSLPVCVGQPALRVSSLTVGGRED